MYCPVKARCLAYRYMSDGNSGKRSIYRSLADRLYEGITFIKKLCDAEGRLTPEIDAMLSKDPRTKQGRKPATQEQQAAWLRNS